MSKIIQLSDEFVSVYFFKQFKDEVFPAPRYVVAIPQQLIVFKMDFKLSHICNRGLEASWMEADNFRGFLNTLARSPDVDDDGDDGAVLFPGLECAVSGTSPCPLFPAQYARATTETCAPSRTPDAPSTVALVVPQPYPPDYCRLPFPMGR
ncbi:hypothetical protein J6590_102281 [Homalodisca vitripennis]|nr:hypothetical protein J6590_102281 [Homalodisca vitripennis]